MRPSLILILLISNIFSISAVAIENNQYPPKIEWKILTGDYIDIIFPSEEIQNARKIFDFFTKNHENIFNGLESKREKFKILLNNRSSVSNGFITLAPKRGEFNITPPQSMFAGNSEWLSTLSLHEGRHIAQFSFLNRGFTKIAGIVFGELGRGAMSVWSVPQWFWEGDAVLTETKYSRGGRGRSAYFDLSLRTLLLNNRDYSYHKSYLSSYRDFVPSVYSMGYFFTSYIDRKFSPKIISGILSHSSSYSINPLIFRSSVKKETSIPLKDLFMAGKQDLKKYFISKNFTSGNENLTVLSAHPGRWSFYGSPVAGENGKIYAYKYSLTETLRIISIDKFGKEKLIQYINPPGYGENIISYSRGKLCWSELRPNPRWGKESYSEIVVYDLKTKNKKRVTKKTRFFSPVLSPDGNRIITVEIARNGAHIIRILDASTGKTQKLFKPNKNNRISFPAWSENGELIVFVEQHIGMKRITILDVDGGTFSGILPYSYENIKSPKFYRNRIFFVTDRRYKDEIWSVDLTKQTVKPELTPKFGAYYPSVDEKEQSLIFCDYNLEGMRVVKVLLDELNGNHDSESAKNYSDGKVKDFYGMSIIQKKIIEKKQSSNSKSRAKIKKYRKLSGLLNFHSRILDPTLPEPTLTFLSDNILNTLSIRTGFSYNTNEKGKRFFFSGQYSELFPIFSFSLSTTGRTIKFDNSSHHWNENELSFGIKIPLDLSFGGRQKRLSFSIFSNLVHFFKFSPGTNLENGNLISLSYRINFSSFRYRALRDIIPPSGYYFKSVYTHSPFRSVYSGSLLSFSGGVIIKGVKRNQQFFIRAGYEKQDPVNYIFSSELVFPRGYEYIFSKSLFSTSVEYIFPLFYPDLAIGDYIYIKRIRGNIFFDTATLRDNENSRHIESVGGELLFDFHLFSIPVELFGGLRISYRITDNTIRVSPLFFSIGF